VTWKETFSGRRFDLLNPDPAQVAIGDIARSLSYLVRFDGHTREPYTVAEHSLHVAWLVRFSGPLNAPLEWCALHHDSREAYVGDMVQPMKLAMREKSGLFEHGRSVYDEIEDSVHAAVERGLGLPKLTPDTEDVIKKADLVCLAAERRVFMPNTGKHPWGIENIAPPPVLVERMRSPEWRWVGAFEIRARFLAEHEKLRAACLVQP